MRLDEQQLLAIVNLGHDTLSRGDALALHEAFERSGYTKLIGEIRRSKLVPLLRTHPEMLQKWVRYCEAKPNRRGYRVSPDSFEVGDMESQDGMVTRYGSVHEAVAEFIVREIGFWSMTGQLNSAPRVLPTVDELVSGLDQKQDSEVGQAQNRLFLPYGIEVLIPRLMEAFGRIKSWRGRNVILFELIRFARKRPEVLQLALAGLKDAAFLVRMQSCIMLAYSQRKDMIPHLEQALSHKDKKTREHAAAAIEHIENKTVFYDFHVPL
jgi:hypothetical protein